MKKGTRVINQFINSLTLSDIYEATGQGISVHGSDLRIIYQNNVHRNFFGEMAGEYCRKAYEGKDGACEDCSSALTIKNGSVQKAEKSIQTGKGLSVFEFTAAPLKDTKGDIVAIVEAVRDITDLRRNEETLRETAITDSLTGLPDRRGFFTLSEQQFKQASRTKKRQYLLCLDLYGMKDINERLGREAGDQALVDMANILKRTFREADIIGRIESDKFVVLLEGPTEPDIKNIITGHLQENLQIYNEQGGRSYKLLTSMGIARYDPEYPSSLDELLSHAAELIREEIKTHVPRREVIKPPEAAGTERRKHVRSACDNCWVTLDDSEKVRVIDISADGICLKTRKLMATGGRHELSLPSESDKISLRGETVWSYLMGTIIGQPDYESGLKFVEMDENESTSASLKQFIAKSSVVSPL